MEQYKTAKEFIEANRKEERAAFEKERDEILLSLGLIDQEKSVFEYSDKYEYPKFINYDEEKKKYYRAKLVPIEVTDEEYLEIKKIYDEKNKPALEIDNSAERTLNGFNIFILVICIIGSIVLFIVGCNAYDLPGLYIVGAIVLLLFSLFNWATIRAFINISNNLHEINKKLK